MPTLQIIIASTRPGRVGLPVAQWVEERARAHGAFDVELATDAMLTELARTQVALQSLRPQPA
jgi:NAD(P)H-dependent FMN reductase